jgi:hypothetical protein
MIQLNTFGERCPCPHDDDDDDDDDDDVGGGVGVVGDDVPAANE